MQFRRLAAVVGSGFLLQGCMALQNQAGDADTFGMIALAGLVMMVAAMKWTKDMSMLVIGGAKLIRFVFFAGLILLLLG